VCIDLHADRAAWFRNSAKLCPLQESNWQAEADLEKELRPTEPISSARDRFG